MIDPGAASADDEHPVTAGSSRNRGQKSPDAFRTISEAARELDLPQHVLRFWESKFPQIKPLKRSGGRRYYRPEDIVTLQRIKDLLHVEGYTIKGAQKLLRDPAQRIAVRDNPATKKNLQADSASVDPRSSAAERNTAAPDFGGAIDSAITRLTALRNRLRSELDG